MAGRETWYLLVRATLSGLAAAAVAGALTGFLASEGSSPMWVLIVSALSGAGLCAAMSGQLRWGLRCIATLVAGAGGAALAWGIYVVVMFLRFWEF